MEEKLNQMQQVGLLFTEIREYYKSVNFQKLMDFCVRFKHLSPYNAWLAQLQMPGARYVLSEREWEKKYNRKIKTNARPIIILIPFGPIDVIFDIGDTMPMPTKEKSSFLPSSDEEILSAIERPFLTKGIISKIKLQNLLDNLVYSGIAKEDIQAGSNFAARIEINSEHMLEYKVSEDLSYFFKNDYLISVNSKADNGELFASLCHELGHLFCHHLPNKYGGWKTRYGLGHRVEEFEAETVSWLVCKRNGISTPSENYLAGYIQNGEIPKISINSVLLAVNEIERLINSTSKEALKTGLLMRYSKKFKEEITKLKNQLKPQKS